MLRIKQLVALFMLVGILTIGTGSMVPLASAHSSASNSTRCKDVDAFEWVIVTGVHINNATVCIDDSNIAPWSTRGPNCSVIVPPPATLNGITWCGWNRNWRGFLEYGVN